MEPVVDPAGWLPEELASNEDWIYELSGADCDQIGDAVSAVQRNGLEIKNIRKSDFKLSGLAKNLAEIRNEFQQGRGFVLIRGLPVADMTREQSAIAFWGIGAHLGRAVSQNGQGHLLGHVKDVGGDYTDKNTRGYLSNAQMGFHADRCDYVALLCLQTSKSGGESRIASSVSLYNKMLSERPDLVAELCENFYWSRVGEIPPGLGPFYLMPVFSFDDGHICIRGVSTQIYKSQGLEGVPDYTEKQHEALDYFKATVEKLSFDMEFRPGDIQVLHNHVILHSRRGYEDWPEPERRRHLLRLWIRDDAGRPLMPEYMKAISGIELEGVELNTPLDVPLTG
ncbi:MAG: hypothetical protein CMM52_06750 [Rhodospirillaceae bacterium]|nr:hypothetical protein [Rhodospirillaceae bacterium]|tara:strand:- start:14621 stop:15637 length:1017 start_codon:yes stop_codon:yes gene_type:complete